MLFIFSFPYDDILYFFYNYVKTLLQIYLTASRLNSTSKLVRYYIDYFNLERL